MKAIFCPSKINGKITAVTSKSYAHRALIAAHFSGAEVRFFSTNDDIEATKNCLKSLSGDRVLNCNESGSTLRFMMVIAAALGGSYKFIGSGRLLSRPLDDLVKVLREHGVTVNVNTDSVKINGKLSGESFTISGNVSSQYVTGLMLALPLIGGGEIVLDGKLSSRAYVDITKKVMQDFGISVQDTDRGYKISGKYNRVKPYTVEGDWSGAAFPLAMGALSGSVTVSGLNANSVQGDKFILEIFKRFGADVKVNNDEVTVSKNEFKAFSFDADGCPDLVPVAAVLGAIADGVTKIKNVWRLHLKESDRVQTVIEFLKAFNVKAYEEDNSLFIIGGKPTGGETQGFNDHRIAMSVAVLGTVADGNVILNGAECVSKSYPSFYKDYLSLGGIMNER